MTRRLTLASLSSALLLVATACGNARTVELGTAYCPSWKQEVGAALTTKCTSCHSGATPAGGVDLTSYQAAISGPGRDKLATVLDPGTADAVHKPFSDQYPLVHEWATQCQLSYVRSSIHPPGILDPTSDDFHGEELQRLGWRLEVCAKCHGDDWKGGTAKVACTTCHTKPGGPTACDTCHGQPPASGAHLAHITSPRLQVPVACSECHKVPDKWDAPGHLDASPVELTFGPRASASTNPSARKGPPSYDFSSHTCSNIGCHGDALGDPAAKNTKPVWTGGPSQADCGTCHGIPPTIQGHPADNDCARCHVPAGPGPTHVNGVVDLGDPALGCNACHNNPQRPLSGAHNSHVLGLHRVTAPLACSECHKVPTMLLDPGHIDTPAPAEVMFGALATTRSSPATWDTGSRNCSGVYCHRNASPINWNNAPPGAAACGTCHELPPPTGDHHPPTLTLNDCVKCHAATVDAFGNIIVTGGTSAHINGRTDLVAP